MATRGSRNNLLAGIFVLLSIALGVAVVILLSDLGERLTPMSRYIVRFSLTDGAEGLRQGSQVKVGGQPVGRVLGWRFAIDPAGDPFAIDVEVAVRADIAIYEDATALLVLPLLGTSSQINIPDLGDGRRVAADDVQGASPRLEEGEVLRGHLAAPAFLAQAGYGDEQRQQVQLILRNMADVSDRFTAITTKLDAQLDPAIEELRAILADARSVSTDVRAQWPHWREQVDSSLDSLAAASRRAGEITDAVQAGVDDARAMISENRARVSSAVQDIEELAAKINSQGWESVQALLDRAGQGVDEFAASAERVHGIVREASPELRTLVANARLASDQLKLTSAEVRAAPWKLLSRPTGRRELENEVLYDAARQYAQAVSDLRAASASLESVAATAGAPRSPVEQERIERLVATLENAFARYQQAEREFLSRLTGPPPQRR